MILAYIGLLLGFYFFGIFINVIVGSLDEEKYKIPKTILGRTIYMLIPFGGFFYSCYQDVKKLIIGEEK